MASQGQTDRSIDSRRGRPDVRHLLAHYLPISAWLPAFPRQQLRPELLAALTSWGVMVPVALAYASLAGMPAAWAKRAIAPP